MFTQLPEEMERMVWEKYRYMYVFPKLKESQPIWNNPSDTLLELCKDIGCIQHGHSEMDKTLFSNGNWFAMKCDAYISCFSRLCTKCVYEGFPCNDSIHYGSMNPKLTNHWNMEHYENSLRVNDEIDISAGYV
jgi:hypothetical protein